MRLPYHLRRRAIAHQTRLGVMSARERHANMANPGYTLVQASGQSYRYWHFEPVNNETGKAWSQAIHFARHGNSLSKTMPIYIVAPDGTAYRITKRRIREENPPDPYYPDKG